MSDGLQQSVEKMRAAGLADVAVDTFAQYYERLRAGEAGVLAEDELEPVTELPEVRQLPQPGEDLQEVMDQAVVLKLNGGLGTSMGMTQAKSLLEVKDGLTFLDVIARQVLAQRARHGARLPLVLMNSFATRADSLAALARYPALVSDVPPDFVQNRVPKVRADDLTPVSWDANPDLEWAPPGHGDLYTALVTSGMLDRLRAHDYRYAFVSNSDNLGAVLDPRILAWFAREDVPFLMEVADRTEADKKGGHLARRRDGGLVLRESAQAREEDMAAFQDIRRHRFFNTNTLWLNLDALARVLDERSGVLGLPMIVNRKTVDPSDPASPEVVQLETAMGAAIDVFEDARALRVPRSRFAPVKTTNELLVVRSDAYRLAEDARIELAPGRDAAPYVGLDDAHYKLIADFDARFPAGPPSLVEAERLEVTGDVTFGHGVVVRGSVAVEGPRRVEDGAVLEG
jgi:UTP--glucose-1-phosphate uridylyltransferase